MSTDSRFAAWRGAALCCCLLAGACLPVAAGGQVVFEAERPDEEAVEEIRNYLVELIVFEYADERLPGNEVFSPAALPDVIPAELPEFRPQSLTEYTQLGPVMPPTLGDPGTIFEPGLPVAIDDTKWAGEASPEYRAWLEAQPLEELPSHILQTRLRLVDPAEQPLQDAYARLVQLAAYEPIVRTAWTQAVYERDQTLPINLRRLGYVPLRLDGTIMLYLSRYLHLVVDLTIEAEPELAAASSDSAVPYFGDGRGQAFLDFEQLAATRPVQYRISEDRIFRNGEVRYFDHPRFGVLTRISRVEDEAAAEEQAADGPLLLPED